MIRTIFSFIGALIGYVWSFLRILRWPIVIITTIVIITFFSITGYAFKMVYDGIILFLIIFAIISLFIQPLRWILLLILTVGGIFFAYNTVFLNKVVPYVEDGLSKNLPAYQEWKDTKKSLANIKLAEKTISAKKEMVDSEVTKGTFGIITEDSVAYDENGSIIPGLRLKKNQRIMSLGLGSKSQSEDPNGIGTEGMTYVLIANEYGDFVKSRSALVPIRKIEWESNRGKNTSSTVKTGWVEIENRIVDFSQIRMVTFGPNQCMAEIPLPIKISESGNYRMKFSGNWEFLMSNGRWSVFPWNGNNALAGRPEFRPEQGLNFGSVILINNGENITPVSNEGFVTSLGENSVLLVRINVLLRPDEYIGASGIALRNSMALPLTITIEKEVTK